ncbi:DUF3043 domain-containing protein [Salininema proteolyticum]|uniref:DUF3043 domain-containing protein n=1 Tax=Salininema proteolyticum TaxID=1607685 RepID=A0ABV8TVR0_9ACTN
MAKKPEKATDKAEDPVEETAEERRATDKKGKATPKQPKKQKARPPANPPMSYKEMRQQRKAATPKSKEEKKAFRDARRSERAKISEGQWRGDPLYDQYHLPRDKGKVRLLARDIVDSRRNVAQYLFFFAIALLILSPVIATGIGAYGNLAINLIWLVILLSVVVDSVILVRKTKRLVNKRYPDNSERSAGLAWYVISRSIMFRSMRQPRIRMTYKAKEDDLGKVIKD